MTEDRVHQDLDLERLAAIVSSSDDAIISKNLNGIVSTWNKGAETILGYTAEEMIGQPILRIIPPELHDEEELILSKLRAGERIEHFDTVRVAKDGRRVELSLTVSPLRDPNGSIVGASKVARDISERRRAEELQKTLLDELNHRVKNTLAVVQSIANQSLRTAPDPASFVAAFSGRIRALAASHDLLVREQLAGVNLRDLAQQQIALGADEAGRFLLRGPNMIVGGTTGTHLGMIVHELATNARKYGALSTPSGTLVIDWDVERVADGATLRLSWQESGAPAPSPTPRQGFGTILLKRVAESCGGSVDILDGAQGRTILLRLPLEDYRLVSAPAPAPARTEALLPSTERNLQGRRVLVVEDELVVSMDLEMTLRDEGCTVLGPARTVEQALIQIAATSPDLAVLDVNLHGKTVERVAEALRARGVPFIFATGYGPETLPPGWKNKRLLSKPFSGEQLVAALSELAKAE